MTEERVSRSTERQRSPAWARLPYADDDDVQTIPELGAELRSLRYELRAYVERHDREHERQSAAVERVAAQVSANTDWRTARQAQERILAWLIGSNFLAWAMLALAVLALVIPRFGGP